MRCRGGGWRKSLGNYYPQCKTAPSSSLLLSDEEDKMTSEEENNSESEYDEEEEEEDEDEEEEEEADRHKLAKGFYAIEDIRKKRIHKGQRQYLIKWRDWPESANTWEPIGNLGSCSDLIKAFENRSFGPSKKGKCEHKPGSSHTPFKKRKHLTAASTSFATQPSSNGPRNSDSTEGIQAEPFSVQVADDLLAETGHSENPVGENQNKETNEANPQSSQEKLPDEVNVGNFSIQMADTGVSEKEDQPKDVNPSSGAKGTSGCASNFNPNSELPEPAHQSPAPEHSENAASDNHNCSPTIVKILKCVSYRCSVASGNTPTLRLTFRALRSDGQEVNVGNNFLKENYPHLLIRYYEKAIPWNRVV